MARHIELNPVSYLTIGAVGSPGNRIFYLQGSQGKQTISLIMEKEQARMLADSFHTLLAELDEKHPLESREAQMESMWKDMRLREPIEELFRIGNMGLGYNEGTDQIVLVAYELVEEDEEPNVVSFWTSRKHIQALIKHTIEVVSAGRPVCGNCGQPIDPEGHFCPHRNGHNH
ncbi:MAG: DUF3090 family protein [Chloroflexi bacterium]|nr:DUF3090 family protein [Chloroflexota bacterium]